MKLALICPSNKMYMPYIRKYEEVLKQTDITYDCINWDRFHIEEDNQMTYKDSKIGHQRNIIDYLRFRKFVINLLNNSGYDKVIVFGVQLSFILSKYLIDKYKLKYLIDIRDYNKLLNIFTIKKTVSQSYFTAISSPGFTEWLPVSNKYVISHNTKTSYLHEYNEKDIVKSSIILSYIGSIRDSSVNIALIEDVCNSDTIHLEYHGEGDANKELSNFIVKNKIKNVNLTGRYSNEKEEEYYKLSNMINILIHNNDINSKTLLTNRLYQAVIYGRPILTNEGSFQATIIKKYNLGLVINKIENVEKKIIEYLNEFNSEEYNLGRKLFFEKVLQENIKFENTLSGFINSR